MCSYLSCICRLCGEFVYTFCDSQAGVGWFCLKELLSLQLLSFTPKRAFCAARLLCPLSLFSLLFFFPFSLALPQLVRFQIWPSCSNYTLPTAHICTASTVKNVSVFPRNTVPEGALNDVPGRVNTGDSDLLFLMWLLAPSPNQQEQSQ